VIETDGEEQKPEYIDATEMPQFEFRPHTAAQALSSAVVDFGFLSVFNLLFFAGTIVAFVRYDVR